MAGTKCQVWYGESDCLGLQFEEGGRLHLRLNMSERPIANKYREGKLKRTLERGLKVREIADREPIEPVSVESLSVPLGVRVWACHESTLLLNFGKDERKGGSTFEWLLYSPFGIQSLRGDR